MLDADVLLKMLLLKKALSKKVLWRKALRRRVLKKRAQKTARNISKNTTIIIPEHNIPSFKPAKTFTISVKED